jgi:hypothetical protein
MIVNRSLTTNILLEHCDHPLLVRHIY